LPEDLLVFLDFKLIPHPTPFSFYLLIHLRTLHHSRNQKYQHFILLNRKVTVRKEKKENRLNYFLQRISCNVTHTNTKTTRVQISVTIYDIERWES